MTTPSPGRPESTAVESVRAFAPGRVNLIGEHTDYTGGLVLPMALDMGITISGHRTGTSIDLYSEQLGSSLSTDLPIGRTLPREPSWGRYVAAVARKLDLPIGFEGTITSTLPAGGTGLSSSSALTVAAFLAFGGLGEDSLARRKELAELARITEAEASGVLSGIMDQLISITAIEGHASMIDCHTLDITPVPVPSTVEILVFHSGQPRILADSEYNERRAACASIEAEIGPLRTADLVAVDSLADPVLRRRARHVVTENQRVRDFVAALAAGDLDHCGLLLDEGHRSLSEDYETSTPIVDEIQARVSAVPGVYGARMVGGGFGGALVAMVEPGTELELETWSIRARPGPGAYVTTN
jgi:galactokinase